jgi:hypothetical protein
MKIAIVTLDGFNEIDSFVALSILSRVKVDGWSVQITAPEKSVTSMNGVEIKARQKLSFATRPMLCCLAAAHIPATILITPT